MSESDVYRLQILAFTVGPRAERFGYKSQCEVANFRQLLLIYIIYIPVLPHNCYHIYRTDAYSPDLKIKSTILENYSQRL